MLKEFPPNQPIIINDERLGGLFGNSDTWVQKLEKDGVIQRVNRPKERALFDLEQSMPAILEHQFALKRRRYEEAKIRETKERVRRLKMENDVRAGILVPKAELLAEWGPRFTSLRRHFETLTLMGIPQAVIDSMLTELGSNGSIK